MPVSRWSALHYQWRWTVLYRSLTSHRWSWPQSWLMKPSENRFGAVREVNMIRGNFCHMEHSTTSLGKVYVGWWSIELIYESNLNAPCKVTFTSCAWLPEMPSNHPHTRRSQLGEKGASVTVHDKVSEFNHLQVSKHFYADIHIFEQDFTYTCRRTRISWHHSTTDQEEQVQICL